MKTGFDIFRENSALQKRLKGKRLAYLGNCASVSKELQHSFDLLKESQNLNFTCLFSPQHGWDSVEQANMIPSPDGKLKDIPIFSLYTDQTRKMTPEQLEHFDVLLIDLQDVGCRIYTFLTTVLYAMKSCANSKKSIVILDRPNPVGRMVEGSYLNMSYQSVVGAWYLPMRYGLTLGEVAKAYQKEESLDLSLEVVKIEGYGGEGWSSDRIWIAPSPNMTSIKCALCYSGTVLLEGTNISEGRGTTSPLQVFGFPNMKTTKILQEMKNTKEAWLDGCILRPCSFKPTFDKFKDDVCSALHIHITKPEVFRPYRLICLFLKVLKKVHPDFNWELPPPYEYEYKKPPIDILSGDNFLREWINDSNATTKDLENKLSLDEKDWKEKCHSFYLY